MKTTKPKPKPGAAAKPGVERRRTFRDVGKRFRLVITNASLSDSVGIEADNCGMLYFSPATARRIARALLAAAGGTP